MKTTKLIAALAALMTAAQAPPGLASDWHTCGNPPPKWALKPGYEVCVYTTGDKLKCHKESGLFADADDPVWTNHALCNAKTHKVHWCWPAADDLPPDQICDLGRHQGE